MEPPQATRTDTLEPPTPGRFRLGQLLVWLPASAVLGVLVAWSAAAAQRLFAPLLLFPLLAGVVLGLLIVALVRLCHVGHRPTIVAGALLAVLLAVVGQHYASYWKTRHPTEAPPKELLARLAFPDLQPPESFLDYLRREAETGRPVGGRRLSGGLAWLTWSVDALLVLAPAMVLVVASSRLPYCNRCRRWYHTIRGRRISPVLAAEIAQMLGIRLEGRAESARYRIIACHRGCGPTGLALFWDDRSGSYSSDYVWLAPPHRNRVLEVLDRQTTGDQDETPGAASDTIDD